MLERHRFVDVSNFNTFLSSLALTIFRKDYYDEMRTHIAIPHRTAEEFICRGYYGGHADVYMPIGDNLLYYYVYSLYPFLMKSSPMPIGAAKWDGNLHGFAL
jgi:hypothetical protein